MSWFNLANPCIIWIIRCKRCGMTIADSKLISHYWSISNLNVWRILWYVRPYRSHSFSSSESQGCPEVRGIAILYQVFMGCGFFHYITQVHKGACDRPPCEKKPISKCGPRPMSKPHLRSNRQPRPCCCAAIKWVDLTRVQTQLLSSKAVKQLPFVLFLVKTEVSRLFS